MCYYCCRSCRLEAPTRQRELDHTDQERIHPEILDHEGEIGELPDG